MTISGYRPAYRMLPVKKLRKFGGKTYHWREYVAMKSEANNVVRQLRRQGMAARVTAQPGYGTGGWNIYVRK